MAKISTYLESTLNFVLGMKYFESFIIFLENINFVRGFPSRASPTVITDYVITSRSCFFTRDRIMDDIHFAKAHFACY